MYFTALQVLVSRIQNRDPEALAWLDALPDYVCWRAVQRERDNAKNAEAQAALAKTGDLGARPRQGQGSAEHLASVGSPEAQRVQHSDGHAQLLGERSDLQEPLSTPGTTEPSLRNDFMKAPKFIMTPFRRGIMDAQHHAVPQSRYIGCPKAIAQYRAGFSERRYGQRLAQGYR